MVTHRLSLFIMIIITCAFLLLDRAEAQVFERAREAAADALTPVFEIFSGPVSAIRDFLGGIQGYLAVHEENARLRDENARLLGLEAEVQQLRRVIDRYDALLTVQIDPAISYAAGRVVADDGGPFRRTVVVNAGTRAGVDRGQAVIDEHGLIGRVVGAGVESSRVLLVSDLNSRIPVFVEPGRRRAILAGDNSNLLRLDFLSNVEGLAAGDRVVTTGEGGLMPPGLSVGIVAGERNGIWRVRSATRFDSIDFVRIMRFQFPREIDDPDMSLPPGAQRIERQEIAIDEQMPSPEVSPSSPGEAETSPPENEGD